MDNVRTFFTLTAGLLAGLACAAVVTKNDDTGAYGSGAAQGPNTPALWSDGLAPHSDAEYLVNGGKSLGTWLDNNSGTMTFTGGLLTFGDASSAGVMRCCGNNNDLFFPNGIRFVKATGCSCNLSNYSDDDFRYQKIHGPIEIASTVAKPQLTITFRERYQHLHFTDAITGDANTGIQIGCNGSQGKGVATNSCLYLEGDLAAFYGEIALANSGSGDYREISLALGSVNFPGTVNLSGGAIAFLKTAEIGQTAKVGTLNMADGAHLRYGLSFSAAEASTIKVESTLTRAGTQKILVDCATGFDTTHAAFSAPLLTAPSGTTLVLSDYELIVRGAGNAAEAGSFALRVAADADSRSTLYLDVAAFQGAADVVELSTNGSYGDANASGFVRGQDWSPAGVPATGKCYLVRNGLSLYTPYDPPTDTSNKAQPGPDIAFEGDEIILGDVVTQGRFYNQSYAHVKVPKMTIVNGLYYARGAWSGNRHSWLDTELTILATDYAKAGFTTGATWQHFYLEGRLIGDSDAKMYLENNHGTAVDLGIYSDCSAYFGAIQVRSTNSGVTPNFYFYATELPGTLVIGQNSGAPINLFAPNGATFNALEINRPTQLAAGIDTATWASTPIIVTNSFMMNQPITIAATVTGTDPVQRTTSLGGHFVQILKVKKTAGTIDMARVTMGSITGMSNTPNDYFSLEVDDTDPDYYILGLRTYPMRYLKYSDDANIPDDLKAQYPDCTKTPRTSFDEAYNGSDNNPMRVPGWGWDVNERPDFNYDYAVCSKSMRTSSSGTQADQYFQGRRLYLKGDITHQSNSITITNLYLIGGSISHRHNGGSTGVYAGTPYADISYTRSVWGNAQVNNNSTFNIPDQTSTNCLRIGLNFSGSATLDLIRLNGGQSIGSYCDLCGDSSAFTGTFSLKSADFVNDTATRRTFFLFHEQKNLGGDPAAFNQKGINLQCGVTLQPFDSVTVSYVNRGILVNGLGAFGARGGEVFTIDAPVTWCGQANKLGDGVVRFAKAPTFTTAENTAATDVVVEGKNLLRVVAGSVGVHDNASALDGLQISFEGDGALNVRLRDGDASTAATLGVKNVKAATPFVLNAQGKLPVVFDMTDATEWKSRTVAICTVPVAKASTIRGNFQFTPPSRYSVKESETTDGDNVTFLATLGPTGCMIIFR